MCLVLQADQLVCSKEVVRCIQSERQALLQFKSGLIDEFDMLSFWTTEDCCQWYGIGCSNITGHVLMLDLHGDYNYYYYGGGNRFYIRGDIHNSLMELQQLKYLNLRGNYFTDISIPGFIGSLRNLRYHDLSGFDNRDHNGGQWLSNLTSLTHLHMSSILNLDRFNSLLEMVGKLPKLGELNLTDCDLSDHFSFYP
ncbi:receptor-like protein EIX1 [Medicago truncatula]|nr:receptor-like protein EIX1 [Medicago truncatula]